MRLVVSSDFHGMLPSNFAFTEAFDLFLICGDICPAHDHYYSFQIKWMKYDFVNWVNNLPFKDENSKVVITWGNHDAVGERITKDDIKELSELTNGRLIILRNEEYVFNGLKIFGTPYCKQFFNWSFMLPDERLKEKYSKIPDDTDILISHDSPMIEEYGMIHSGFSAGTDAGNKILADFIVNKKPKMCFFGHIHSHDHSFRKIGETWMAGVSYVNESYMPTYMPLEFNYENNEVVVKMRRLCENGPIVIEPKIFSDNRGYFFESFNEDEFNKMTGEHFHPVQDNESKSDKGVIRGLHFQKPPYAQAKLVRVINGSVYDVAVDIRKDSPTYGKWFGVLLSGDNHKQFFIPKGFAHGFISLEDDTIFQYKCDNYYNKASEGAIHYADEEIDIEWGTLMNSYDIDSLIISDKDKNNKLLSEIENPFVYDNK